MSRQEAMELDLPPQKSAPAKKKAGKSSATGEAGKTKQGKAAGLQAPRMYSKVHCAPRYTCASVPSSGSEARAALLFVPSGCSEALHRGSSSGVEVHRVPKLQPAVPAGNIALLLIFFNGYELVLIMRLFWMCADFIGWLKPPRCALVCYRGPTIST